MGNKVYKRLVILVGSLQQKITESGFNIGGIYNYLYLMSLKKGA